VLTSYHSCGIIVLVKETMNDTMKTTKTAPNWVKVIAEAAAAKAETLQAQAKG